MRTHTTLVLAAFLGITGLSSTGLAVEAGANQIGYFRPSTGEWKLDMNNNHVEDVCGIDKCIAANQFGRAGDWAVAIAGGRHNGYVSKIAVFRPENLWWFLDDNRNYSWDGRWSDNYFNTYYQRDAGYSSEQIVSGDFWNGSSDCGPHAQGFGDCVASFYNGRWLIDTSGGGSPISPVYFGRAGDRPVAVADHIGVYRPSTREWFVDTNNNHRYDRGTDDYVAAGYFGDPEDLPVSAGWDGTTRGCIGVFRPSNGHWYVDYNCSKNWNAGDKEWGPFGSSGDIPVVGKWK
jgi:hypothetical protein